MDFCLISDVKTFLTIKGSEQDDTLTLLIGAVSKEMTEYLDRDVDIQTAKVETFDLDRGQYRLKLKAYPVSSITDIRHDTSRAFPTSSIVPTTDYYADLTNGLITFDKYILISGPGVIRVTYTGGMAVSTTAFRASYYDLTIACAQEVAYRLRHRGELGIVSASIAGMAATFSQKGQFMDAVKEVLDRHVRFG